MTNNNQHIPSGYKSSPLGIIPEDWEVKKVKDVSTIKGRIGYRGYTVDDIVDYGNGAISLSPSNIVDGKLQFNSVTSITWEKYYESPEIMLCNGDIVMVKTGSSFGKVAFVDNLPQEATINPQFVIINNIKCDNKWLCYLFDSDCIQKNVHKIVVGGAIPTMSQEEIANFKIAVPTLPEQQRIVSVLSLWDTAIAKQTALIEQLTLRKHGLMQQLLTGKKRLKGFREEWERIKAGEIFKSISVKGNGTEVLLSATQEHGVIPRDQLEGRVTMPTGDTNSFKLVEVGDFVISLRSFQGGLEYSEHRGIVSPAYTVLKPIVEIDKTFYRYYFKSAEFIGHLAIAVIGIRDGKQISYDDFCFVKIPYPNIEEQKAISAILLQGDKEIEIQKQKLLILQEQKKGLMQVLLTGKKRIK